MKIFKETPNFDFIGKRLAFFAVSTILLGVGIASLATRGINWGIDFTGGSVVQIHFAEPTTLPELRGMLADAGYSEAIPQRFTGTDTFAIRIKTTASETADTADEFLAKFEKAVGGKAFEVDSKEFVGPTVGRHLYKQALFAVVFSMIAIVGYVAFRFSNPLWGVAGILALAHDITIALGVVSILGIELDLVIVAALLTISGYSINDSIVIFDRMREKLRTMRRESLAEVLNASINETLSRTLITSLTTFFTVLTLALVGGTVIHDFATLMSLGVVIGTYSSVGVCAGLVFAWTTRPKSSASSAPQKQKGSSPAGERQKGKRARRRRNA
jgi:preprotein translocase subunit SecF